VLAVPPKCSSVIDSSIVDPRSSSATHSAYLQTGVFFCVYGKEAAQYSYLAGTSRLHTGL